MSVLPYLRVWTFGFVYDDAGYITGNPALYGGLDLAGLRWAFATFTMGNWHPITWISHLIDVSLFGLRPGGPHVVNLLLHGGNTILLDLFLRRVTGKTGRSFVVAALFAVHPLHVESVAWISERKDLLSTFFFLAGLVAFQRYAARPSLRRYAAVTALFVFGLLSKAMVVTMPLVLLLCDFWPLQRLSRTGGRVAGRFPWRRAAMLLLEKVPLLALSIGASALAVRAQRQAQALGSAADFELTSRLKNAAASYMAYLAKTLWPTKLSAFYRHLGETLSLGEALAVICALAAVTALALAAARRRGYLVTGWGWYVITLLPVIGLIQVGSQGRADRYTYIPLMGLFIAAVWAAGDFLERARFPARAAKLAAGAIVAALIGLSARQVDYWRDELTLWSRAVTLDRGNWYALTNLGLVLYREKRLAEALGSLTEAVRIDPTYSGAHMALGLTYGSLGRSQEAVASYRRAIALDPGASRAYFNLGLMYLGMRDRAAALAVYREMLVVDAGQAARLLSYIESIR